MTGGRGAPERRAPAAAAGAGRAWEKGSRAHYDDPLYFTRAYRRRRDDVRYYTGLALGSGGPVLEYGCGNGRIALPIARSGIAITGVDRSAPMLRDLRRRLRGEPPSVRQRLALRRGDMCELRLGQRFPLVLCPFNTLLHLYSRRAVERFLRRVREHLTARGQFVFDVSVPDPEQLGADPERRYRAPRFRHPRSGALVRYAERFDYDPLGQVLVVSLVFEPAGRPAAAWEVPLSLRQFFPQEIEALLHYNGLRVLDRRGDFRPGPAPSDCTTLVYHCRARR